MHIFAIVCVGSLVYLPGIAHGLVFLEFLYDFVELPLFGNSTETSPVISVFFIYRSDENAKNVKSVPWFVQAGFQADFISASEIKKIQKKVRDHGKTPSLLD